MNEPSGENYKYLTVIEIDGCDRDLPDYWKMSRFMDKVKSLRLPYITWERNGKERLSSRLKQEGVDAIIYIEGDQLFFDIDVAREAVKKFELYKPDYYTQWEHSRMPVGIGVRILLVKKFLEYRVSSIGDYFDKIVKDPENFHIRYEDHKYTDYALSLLDARYSTATKKFLSDKGKNISWDLEGFISLVKRWPSNMPRYRCVNSAARVDERELRAPYGFESSECAGFPTYIMFDITNACNSQCVHCPHSITYSKTTSRPIFIEMDVFKKAIDECVGKKIQFIQGRSQGQKAY